MKIAAILLAAGLSTRFGAVDKVAVPLDGLPLGLHAAHTLTTLRLDAYYVVSGRAAMDWPGFVVLKNDQPEAGMAHSIRLGLKAAREQGVDAILIALADMPRVPVEHFRRLLAVYRDPASLVASTDGERRMPPALFGSDSFAALEMLRGDQGGRALLDRAELVHTLPQSLSDIDKPSDLLAAWHLRED